MMGASRKQGFNAMDLRWMGQALGLADRAEQQGEVPVGALVVRDGVLLGAGWNRNLELNDASAHAEILAMRAAGEAIGNHRLPGCTLYVTLEPCCMCAGAMIHARLARLVYGATDPKTGAAGSVFDVLSDPRHNHRVQVDGGCCAEQSAAQLRAFFQSKRGN
jgi:tRNA(Arg) A34 adenosine deaminase TadA